MTKEALEAGETRFYRWHQDAPLYEHLPGKVTLIHGLVVPKLPDQKVRFDDGENMELQAGATCCNTLTLSLGRFTDSYSHFRGASVPTPNARGEGLRSKHYSKKWNLEFQELKANPITGSIRSPSLRLDTRLQSDI